MRCHYVRFSDKVYCMCSLWLSLDYNVPGLIIFSFSFSLWLTMVVLRSLSLSPPRPDTTLSSSTGGLVPTRNFPDKLRYRRRAALGEDRLADFRVDAGWWAWSPLMGCVILAESALEDRWVRNMSDGWRKELESVHFGRKGRENWGRHPLYIY